MTARPVNNRPIEARTNVETPLGRPYNEPADKVPTNAVHNVMRERNKIAGRWKYQLWPGAAQRAPLRAGKTFLNAVAPAISIV